MPYRLTVRLLLATLATAAAPIAWSAPPVSEATVKAAFVYNFAKFAEWPADAFASEQDPIRLCLFGSPDSFMVALTEIEGKSAQNRPIRVQKLNRSTGFRGCHILAVAESESRQIQEIVHAAADQGAMTVGEIDGFSDLGGTIGLVVDNARVQFEVNLEAAKRANLKLSSQLLKLARKVRR